MLYDDMLADSDGTERFDDDKDEGDSSWEEWRDSSRKVKIGAMWNSPAG